MTLEIVSNHYDGMWHSQMYRLVSIYKEDGRVNVKFPEAVYCVVYTIMMGSNPVTKYLHYRSSEYRDQVYEDLLKSKILDPSMLHEPRMTNEEAFKLLPHYVRDPHALSRAIVMEAVRRSRKRPEDLYVFRKLNRKHYDYTNLRILAMFSLNAESFVKRCVVTLRCPAHPVLRLGITPTQFFKWITSPPRKISE